MRILNILSSPGIGGGTETLLFSLIPFLEKRECKVDILNVWHNSMMKQPAMKAGLSYSELSGLQDFRQCEAVRFARPDDPEDFAKCYC